MVPDNRCYFKVMTANAEVRPRSRRDVWDGRESLLGGKTFNFPFKK